MDEALAAARHSRAALADTEIARMTAAWRALLVAHQPTGTAAASSARAGAAAVRTRARYGRQPTST